MVNILTKIKSNWKSGVTVSLVSLPLSLSLAVASNTTPVVGVVTAIWAGLIASIFGGSNYNVVGPTGALSGILASYAITHGANMFPMLTVIAGIFVIVAFLLKLERYLVFVPASTIHGFTLGVAFIIALNQFNSAFGIKVSVIHEKFVSNLIESFSHIGNTHIPSLILFLCSLALLFILPKFIKALPSAVVLSPFGILLGYLVINQKVPFYVTTLGEKYKDLSPALFGSFGFHFDSSLVTAGLLVSFIAILETLLSAKVADGMTGTKHDKRKEILGLGLANIAAGLAGGMPATAALARTALNIKSGSTDKLAATINSIAIVVISFVLIRYFSYMPMPIIASILVATAIRMVEKEHLVNLFVFDKQDFFIGILVCAITVLEDPIYGILFGVAVSSVIFLDKISRGQFELTASAVDSIVPTKISGHEIKEEEIKYLNETLVYSFEGQLAYLNAQAHVERFNKSLSEYKNIILRFRSVYFVDIDGVDALDEIIEEIKKQKKNVLICSVNTIIKPILEYSENYEKLKKKGLVFENVSAALTHLGYETTT